MRSRSRTRVLHVITRLIRGGADENTVHTVEGLDPERYEARILAGRGSEVDRFPPSVRARTRILPELVRNPHPWLDLLALAKMTLLMRRGRYAIVHTHTAKAGFLGRIAARAAGVPCVVHTLHGVTFHDHTHPLAKHLYIGLERLGARACDVMITVGEDVKRKYLRERIGHSGQYVVIPSGMDTRPFREARLSPERHRERVRAQLSLAAEDVVVGVVSRLEPRKGLPYLLEAIAHLAPEVPSLRALLVGEGPQLPHLQAQARRLGIDKRVVFAGYRSDIAAAISAFDIAVLTSLWEGLPRALVQYALLEKPIVTFEVEGAREVVEDGLSGYVVRAKDVEQLAERLRDLATNPARRSTMGRRGRARVEGRWDLERMVESIARVYEDVQAGQRPRREVRLAPH